MTSAGSPEIRTGFRLNNLGTTPYAGWEVSIIVAVFMASFGYWWLKRMIKKALAKGERFEAEKKINH